MLYRTLIRYSSALTIVSLDHMVTGGHKHVLLPLVETLGPAGDLRILAGHFGPSTLTPISCFVFSSHNTGDL